MRFLTSDQYEPMPYLAPLIARSHPLQTDRQTDDYGDRRQPCYKLDRWTVTYRVFTRSSKRRADIELAQAGLLEPRPWLIFRPRLRLL